jgi:hydroxymethylglutaryl-CoA reductase (NADPH)
LNFATTLTPATISRYQTQSLIDTAVKEVSDSRRIDITSPAIASVLASLAAVDQTIEAESSVSVPADLLVKISPPLYIRVTPPGPVRPRALFRSTEMLESFMTGWTALVGDPVLSKWIVLVLAVSVALNGYLLKGIAEGAMRGLQPNNVRFRSVVADKREKQEEPVSQAASGRRRSSFVVGDSKPPSPTEEEGPRPIVRPLAIRPMRVLAPIAIPATTANGVSAQMLEMKLRAQAAPLPQEPQPIQFPLRSLEQCIDIFENGPRPASAALATLNDEEVILLAQNGKIAAYALEKVLGDLERAVSIRRSLICKFPQHVMGIDAHMIRSPCDAHPNPRVL